MDTNTDYENYGGAIVIGEKKIKKLGALEHT